MHTANDSVVVVLIMKIIRQERTSLVLSTIFLEKKSGADLQQQSISQNMKKFSLLCCMGLCLLCLLYLQIILIIFSYENPEVALNCGAILRECIRHEPLARALLYSKELYKFFTYVEVANFDTASDAFASFKVCRVLFFFIFVFICFVCY